MKVISNEGLFDRWKRLFNVMRWNDLSSIIQNDMDISDELFKKWKKDFRREKRILNNSLDSVYRNTVKYINELNRKEK